MNDHEDIENGIIELVIPVPLANNLASGEININCYCRICFNESSEMTSIFQDVTHNIAKMFTLFTSIQVSFMNINSTNL